MVIVELVLWKTGYAEYYLSCYLVTDLEETSFITRARHGQALDTFFL